MRLTGPCHTVAEYLLASLASMLPARPVSLHGVVFEIFCQALPHPSRRRVELCLPGRRSQRSWRLAPWNRGFNSETGLDERFVTA